MDLRELGNSGIKVSCIGLGAMPLSLDNRPDSQTSVAVIHAALDAGMTWIDTADVYCQDQNDIGHNEWLVAAALRTWSQNAKSIVVATKGGLERPEGAWTVNGRPEHLKKACETSLRALGVEAIDLYQLHAPDDNVPFEDSVGALADLKSDGKIKHVGLSNVSVEEINRAQAIVEVVSVQNRCNLFERQVFHHGVLKTCEEQNIAFIPHSPVGGNLGHWRCNEDGTLKMVAKMCGITTYQACLAWLLSKSPVMLPIPGASRIESAQSSAAAAETVLDDFAITLLDSILPE